MHAMSKTDPDRDRPASHRYNRTVRGIIAAIVAMLIIAGWIYARNYSGNDTSPVVTNTPPHPPPERP